MKGIKDARNLAIVFLTGYIIGYIWYYFDTTGILPKKVATAIYFVGQTVSLTWLFVYLGRSVYKDVLPKTIAYFMAGMELVSFTLEILKMATDISIHSIVAVPIVMFIAYELAAGYRWSLTLRFVKWVGQRLRLRKLYDY